MNNPAIVPRYVQQQPNPNPPQQGWSCARRITSIALSALVGLGSLMALPFPFSLLGGSLASIALLKWGFKDEENRQNPPAPILVQNPIRNEPVVVPVFAPQPPIIPFWRKAFDWIQNQRVLVADPRAREGIGDGHVNQVVVRQPPRQVPMAPVPVQRAFLQATEPPRIPVGRGREGDEEPRLPQAPRQAAPIAQNVNPRDGYAGGEPRREIPQPPFRAPPAQGNRYPEREEVGQRR